MLDGLLTLFKCLWSRAVPVAAEAGGLDGQARQVLALLAAGMKDEAPSTRHDPHRASSGPGSDDRPRHEVTLSVPA